MKIKLLTIILFFITALLLAGSKTYSTREFTVEGEVSSITDFEINIDNSVLPFDMKGDDVQPIASASRETEHGLQIGTWTLKNEGTFPTVNFTLTPLTGEDSIYYYVQFEYPYSYSNSTYSYKYFTVYSDSSVASLTFDMEGPEILDIEGKGIYVFMKDEAENLEDYASGDYSSTLTVEVVANE